MSKQRTIASPVTFSGKGLHTGELVTMTVLPAEENRGIVFRRTDLKGMPEVAALAHNVCDTARGTTIKDGKASSVGHIAETLCDMSPTYSFDTEWCSTNVSESGSTSITSLRIASGRVPNVVGMGLVDALFLLEQQGIEVTHSGVGRVTKQSIPQGSKITDKTRKIHLTLSI